MSMVRNLAFEADRDLRRRAYEAELEGWKRVALPIAAAAAVGSRVAGSLVVGLELVGLEAAAQDAAA